ncbi:MAG TPA: allantoinase AllB [Candidatus Sulfotelmatobacter sp.]|nr:allantoinase AllB [Candidatus Sulfotelmatobacter sp.]
MTRRTLISGATVVDHESASVRDILIRDGRVEAVGRDLANAVEVDHVERFEGRVILPGAIDPHVHFEEPGRVDREGFATGTQAAAAGGITTLFEHPLSEPPTVTAARYAHKRDLVGRHSYVDYGLWAGAVPGNRGEMPGMAGEGAGGFKAFMLDSEPGFPGLAGPRLLEAMREAARLGAIMLLHAEDGPTVEAATNRLKAENRHDAAAWADARPPAAEIEAVRAAVALAAESSCRMHLVHLTTAASVELASEAARRGLPIRVETCPHYLLLDTSVLAERGPWAKCAPPLRSRDEVEALWSQVLSGRVDFIGSDHAPWETSEKTAGLHDIWAAPNGLQSLQFMTVLMLHEGRRRGLALDALVRLMSKNVAQWLGIFPMKGTIVPGGDADLAVYKAGVRKTLRAADLFDKQKWTPYEGMTVDYEVEATMLRGEWVFRDGHVPDPPRGRFVPVPVFAPLAKPVSRP